MKRINLAYAVLRNPDKRAQYDRQRSYRQNAPQPQPETTPGRRSTTEVVNPNAHRKPAAQRNARQPQPAKSKSVDVNARDEYGNTPLHKAAMFGKGDALRALIDVGADVNVTGEDDETPLHWAAWRGKAKVARALIDAGANVNARDKIGWTPLDEATNRGHNKIVRTLKSAGAKTGSKDDLVGTVKSLFQRLRGS